MDYPKEFNYSESQSEIRYQHRPTNGFDLNRILKGLSDIWFALTPTQKEKKRKLILADWTAFSWSNDKIKRIITELSNLMVKGYTIYLWQSGEIELLTQDTIADKLQDKWVREKMLPLDLSSIIEVAGTVNKIKSDELLILDDYWIYYLLHQDQGIQKRCLSLYKIELLKNSDLKIPITFFTQLMAQSKPPLETLIMDNFTKRGEYSLNQLMEQFPTTSIVRKPQCIDLSDIHLSLMPHLKYYTTNTFGPQDLTKILLRLSPLVRLKKMNIVDELTNIPEITPAALSELKELNLAAMKINTENLKSLAKILPHLKKIRFPLNASLDEIKMLLTSMTGLKEITTLDISSKLSENIPELIDCLKKMTIRIIRIVKVSITVKDILMLLQAFNQSIEKIEILESEIIAPTTNNLLLLNLPFLNTLELIDNIISDNFFKLLTSSAPRLHTIDLSYAKIIDSSFFSLNLLQLKKIILDFTNINESITVQKIINAAPALEYLSFTSKIKETKSLLPNKKSHLKKLNLRADYDEVDSIYFLDIENMNALFQAFPFIETLYLSDFFTTLNGTYPIALKHLTTINWDVSPHVDLVKNEDTLTFFSMIAPNLQMLIINFSKNMPFILQPNIFPFLVSLNIKDEDEDSNKGILLEQLEIYFKAAPNIKTCLIEVRSFHGNFSKLTPGCLPNLEECNFNGAVINRTNLEILYKAAPLLNKEKTEKHVRVSKMDIFDASNKISPLSATRQNKDNLNNNQQDIEAIDADTELKKTTFNVTHIFSPIKHQKKVHPAKYRLDIFHTTELNPNPCTIREAFSQKKQGDLQLHNITFSTAPANYEGVQNLILSNEWQALASLSSLEHMVHYEASQEVEMNYSLRDNLYYIRQKPQPGINNPINPIKVHIRFALYVPEEPPHPESIRNALNYFLQFKEGALSFPDQTSIKTGQDYLNAIIQQKKGACRHRAFAFAHLFQQQSPIRIITNQCHAFVEIQIGLTWIRCDLGGYPAIVHISEPSIEKDSIVPSNIEILNTPRPLFDHFLSALQHIKKTVSDLVKADDYFHQCLQVSEKKWLIECHEASDVDALHYGLWSYCQKIGHPVFYIHTPKDLICSAAFMSRDSEDKGVIHQGPGGPLYDFLNTKWKAEEPAPLLIVNYANFKSQDLACFNSLIDPIRLADRTHVPDEVMIIGLIDQNNPDTIPEADFYSRFGSNRGLCPLSSEVLATFIPELPSSAPISSSEAVSPYVINLYHASDWEQRLLGQWVPDVTGGWCYKEGELQKALVHSTSIELHNGLWNNKEFNRFWREAMQLGYIKRDQCHILLPEHFTLSQREEYDWSTLKEHFSLQISLSLSSKILNPGTVSDFFTHYDIENSHLTQVPGFIKQAQAYKIKTLLIYLTRTVSDDIWAMLLEESKQYGVILRVFCAPEVHFPCYLGMRSVSEAQEWSPSFTETTQMIYSTESDTTLFQLKEKYSNSIIIDVSECTISDLLSNIEQEADKPFSFKKTTCALITLLNQGKTVVLKGHFSTDLKDGLDTFLLNRLKEATVKGRLILLSEEAHLFPYLHSQEHKVSVEEKSTALKHVPEALQPYLEKDSLAKLKTRRDFISIHGPDERSSDEAWEGLISLSANQKDPGLDVSLEHASTFHQGRIQQVKTILSRSPYIFLTGLSGVGKTTFVMNLLHKEGESTLYHGESELLDWAMNHEPGLVKYLFWDEDNLNPSDRTQFEGLYDNNPPGMLINGQYYTLTEQHKMIFAGNPLSIGGNRKLASFFAHHGQALVFDPIPSNVLYHDILKPLFIGNRLDAFNCVINHTELKTISGIICYELLKFYRFICLNSKDELLISPRELQMMALLTLSYYEALEEKDDATAVSIAGYFGYQITQSLLPKSLLPLFQETFYKSSLPKATKPDLQDFHVTESRIPALNLLNSFISLRENRQNTSAFSHESHRSGGLGGLILEGEPGQGKSELVLALLRTRGYSAIQAKKRYYHLPASMALADKEKLLLIAFHEGAVLVIDEINCFPINEQLLNALLMGKTPKGEPATRPGFMIIGTQNPITMAGRSHFSTAIYRRLLKIELPIYTTNEMHDILIHKGILHLHALELISAYETQCALTIKSKRPTYRDVLSIATTHLKPIRLAIEDAKIGKFSAIDSLIHSGQHLRIDLINYYLLSDATTQAYEGLVYLFASSQSMEELQNLLDDIQMDEAFSKNLNQQIRKHHEKRYTDLSESGVFKENTTMKIKYEEKLATPPSTLPLDPWFCSSTINIKKLMEQQKITFQQAWLYTIHYQDIIQPMLLSYAHYPSLIHTRVLATLLNCLHDDAKQIYSIAIKKSGLPPTHMLLDYTPSFFYRQASRQRYKERLVPDELDIASPSHALRS